MKHKLMITAMLAMTGMLNFSCNKSKDIEGKGNDVTYQASLVKRADVESQLVLPGELEGYFETGVMAKVNGYIKTMYVDIGDRVHEGQLLAELEAPELVSQLVNAYSEAQAKEAIFLNSKGKYVRLVQTNKTPGAVSPYDMDLAKTTVISDSLAHRASLAKYGSVKELVNYLKITAPFDGIITERALAPGAFVGPNERLVIPIVKLKKESILRLHIPVPEKQLAEISVGKSVKFTVKSFPDEIFEGKVTRLAKNLNIETRAEIVEIEIDNHEGKLFPGMYATATIPISRKNSIIVPSTALVTNMERRFVIKVVNGKVTYVDVEKGEDLGDKIEIFGHLNEADTLLNAATDEIRNNSQIKVIVVNDNLAENKK